jgi:prepilin-type N-terminal cleavage/methylation domain-containing protein
MHRAFTLPPATRPAAQADSGFTLLEMLVVLAITGFIAALLFPQLETARIAVRERATREALADGVQGARAMALRSGAPATLSAEDSGTALLIAGAGTRRITLGPAGQAKLALRPAGIVFHPDGSATGGELVLGAEPNTARFVVDPATSQLRALPRASGNGG